MNFTVLEFGEFLLKANLSSHFDLLGDLVNDMTLALDQNACESTTRMKPPKLRWETTKGTIIANINICPID